MKLWLCAKYMYESCSGENIHEICVALFSKRTEKTTFCFASCSHGWRLRWGKLDRHGRVKIWKASVNAVVVAHATCNQLIRNCARFLIVINLWMSAARQCVLSARSLPAFCNPMFVSIMRLHKQSSVCKHHCDFFLSLLDSVWMKSEKNVGCSY